MNKNAKKSGNRIVDRRVQKSKKLLSDALVSLILEKGYEEVTIQDILDRANIGRSTFYAHFENKEQLLLFGHEHLRNLALKEGSDRIDFLSFYRHLTDKHLLAAKLLSGGRSEEVVTRSLYDILHYGISRLYESLVAKTSEQRAMLALRTDAAAAALVQLMTSWIRSGMPYPPEAMAAESTALTQRILCIEAAPGLTPASPVQMPSLSANARQRP